MSRSPEDETRQLRQITPAEIAILAEFDAAARSLSFYNAAEGKQYSEEAGARAEAATRFERARLAVNEIGYTVTYTCGNPYLC